jgi:hypothetical protein
VPPNVCTDNDTVLLASRVTINPAPESGTYAMPVAGLAIMGRVARRQAREGAQPRRER